MNDYDKALEELDLHMDNARILENKYCTISMYTLVVAANCIRKVKESEQSGD